MVIGALETRSLTMIRTIGLATTFIAAVCLAGAANAADARARPGAPAAAAAAVAEEPVQDCSVFYDDYKRRGFGWGSGPGSSLGFGTFEGALPRYPANSFPNWYGSCLNWGHYSAARSVRR
jgi:hypothetical protein